MRLTSYRAGLCSLTRAVWRGPAEDCHNGQGTMAYEERLRMLALFSMVIGRLEGQADGKGNHKDKEAKFSAVADSWEFSWELSKGKQPQTDIWERQYFPRKVMLLLICFSWRLWSPHILESVQDHSPEKSDPGMATALLFQGFRPSQSLGWITPQILSNDSVNAQLRTTFMDASLSVQASSSSLSQPVWSHWCLFTLIHILQKTSEIRRKKH